MRWELPSITSVAYDCPWFFRPRYYPVVEAFRVVHVVVIVLEGSHFLAPHTLQLSSFPSFKLEPITCPFPAGRGFVSMTRFAIAVLNLCVGDKGAGNTVSKVVIKNAILESSRGSTVFRSSYMYNKVKRSVIWLVVQSNIFKC